MKALEDITHQDDVLEIVWRTRLTANEKHVLMRYVKAGPLKDGRLKDAFVSNLRVSKELSMGVSTIEKVRRSLKKRGIIREVDRSERNSRIKNTFKQSQVEIMIPNLIALAEMAELETSPLRERGVTPTREGYTPVLTPTREGLTTNVLNNKNNNNVVSAPPVVSASQVKDEDKPDGVAIERSVEDRIKIAEKAGEINCKENDLLILSSQIIFHIKRNKKNGKTVDYSLRGAMSMIKKGVWDEPKGWKEERDEANRKSQRQTGTWFDPGCSRVEETEEENERKRLESLPKHLREKLEKQQRSKK